MELTSRLDWQAIPRRTAPSLTGTGPRTPNCRFIKREGSCTFPRRAPPPARSVGACSAAAALALRGRPRIRRRATLPRSPRPTAQRCRHAAHLWVVAPSALAHRLTLGLRPSRTGLAYPRFTRQGRRWQRPTRPTNSNAALQRSTPPAACSLLSTSDGQRTQPSSLSGMGLINREKRQHARPARTMTPPTFACAGVRPPAALWCAARHTRVRRRLATLARCAHTCFPRPLPWVPRLRTRLRRVNSGALSRTLRPLCASCALHASDRPSNFGFLWS